MGIVDVLTNPDMLTQFKKNALEQASRFDIHKIMPQYEQFYMKVIDEVMAAQKH